MSIKSRLLRLQKKAGINDVQVIRTLAGLVARACNDTDTDKKAREYRLSPQLAALIGTMEKSK